VPANPSGSRPRQARAVATRLRIYEAAMAEFERVGVDEARVEDIVREAGVAWGTFFHYFPRKQDVLLESSAQVCVASTRRSGRASPYRRPCSRRRPG